MGKRKPKRARKTKGQEKLVAEGEENSKASKKIKYNPEMMKSQQMSGTIGYFGNYDINGNRT